MKKVCLLLSVFAAVLAMTAAHVCMLSPRQRGSMTGINKGGANDCILTSGPCGGRMPEKPHSIYKPGDNITIILQKNLDHWTSATPGYFAVNLVHGTITEIVRMPDTSAPSLTIYQLMGTIPSDSETGSVILQVVYVTKNPQAPAMFYQCADIQIN